MNDAEHAAAAFDLGRPVVSVQPHPTGHINDAYLVETEQRRYLLQRLNPSVFSDPDAVMANVVTVTRHLRAKDEPTLTLVPAADGGWSWRDDSGAVWRLYRYLEGAHPLDVESPADAAEVGHAFGRFHRLTCDLDPASLSVSIPRFHDPARRVADLESAVADDSHNRLGDASAIVERLLSIGPDDVLSGLPVRVAHNDAKAANLLVDEIGGRPPLVADLDTVMAGSVLWDVGDMIRSSTGTADEDTAAVAFDVERYDALVEAWLTEVDDLLIDEERVVVPRAGVVVTFEQAVRFLTDHLRGDVYFRVRRPGENLDRATNQLALLQSMEAAL